jgi:hypothetical protein
MEYFFQELLSERYFCNELSREFAFSYRYLTEVKAYGLSCVIVLRNEEHEYGSSLPKQDVLIFYLKEAL